MAFFLSSVGQGMVYHWYVQDTWLNLVTVLFFFLFLVFGCWEAIMKQIALNFWASEPKNGQNCRYEYDFERVR